MIQAGNRENREESRFPGWFYDAQRLEHGAGKSRHEDKEPRLEQQRRRRRCEPCLQIDDEKERSAYASAERGRFPIPSTNQRFSGPKCETVERFSQRHGVIG